MATKSGTDATATHVTETLYYLDNSGVRTSVTKSRPLVVKSDAVITDTKHINEGVVIKAQQTK